MESGRRIIGAMTDTTSAGATAAEPTIFDRIGGADAVAAVVDLFYDRVLADPDLVGYFEGQDIERIKGHQRNFVGQALGARRPYSGRTMRRAHEQLAITSGAFDKVVAHLAASLAEAGVDEETIGTIAGVLGPLKPEIVTA